MGVDAKIYLPAYARASDVADVIGRLMGCPVEKRAFGSGRIHMHIVGTKVSPIATVAECCCLEWKGGLGLRPEGLILYHFEFGCEYMDGREEEMGDGSRGIMPRSTPLWLAAGRRLIEFFGGAMCHQDYDDKINLRLPWRKPVEVCPGDGEEWYTFQARKAAVKPLTREDVEQERRFAAYDRVPWEEQL